MDSLIGFFIKVADVEGSAIKEQDEWEFYITIHIFTTAVSPEIYSAAGLV